MLKKIQNLNHEKATELDLFGQKITKIEGLEKFTKLRKLEFSKNEITKIEGLEKLTSLNKLDLSYNQITKIEGLEKLTSLNELYLSSNQITKIEGLEKLTSLNILDLHKNEISKIEGLEKLKSLNSLNLDDNKILKIEGLEKLTSLNSLNLDDNKILKIEGLEKLTSLNTLSLSFNKILKIEGLEKLTSLNKLYLNDNHITKIEGLEKMKKLKELILYSNQITLIQGMERFTNCDICLSLNLIEKNHQNEIALKSVLDNKNDVDCEIDISKKSYIDLILKQLSVEEESNTNISRFFKNNLFLDFHQKIYKTLFFFNTIVNDTFKHFKDIKYFEGEDQEIILVEIQKDMKLQKFIENDINIRKLKNDYLSEHKIWKKSIGKLKEKSLLKIKKMIEENVIQKISTFFGGVLKKSPYDIISFFVKCEKEVLELQNKNKSHFVKLGEIKTGVCRHRSLAFKLICDYIGLPCRLLGGTMKILDDELPHMWNVIYLGNKFFAVDVLNSLKLKEEQFFNQFRRSYMNEDGFGTIGGPTLFLEEKKETIEWIIGNYRQKGSIASNEGVTSTIYKIDCDRKSFAVKEFQLKDGTSTIDFRKCFRKEIYYLRILNHPNVVKFVDCFVNRVEEVKEIKSQTGTHREVKKVLLPGIILGYYDCSGEKLLLKLKDFKNQHEALIQVCVFLLGSAMGLRYLHSMSIFHLDLKPSNILIKWKDEKNVVIENVAICDFGGCKENLFKRGVSKYDAPYTLGYCAPERFQQLNVIKVLESENEIIVDQKSDIYSFGKIMSQFKDYFYKDRRTLSKLESDCIKNDSSKRPSLGEIIYALRLELEFLKNGVKEEIIDFAEFCRKGNKKRPMKMMKKSVVRRKRSFKDDFSDFKDRSKNEQLALVFDEKRSNDLNEKRKKVEEDKLKKAIREFEEKKKKQEAKDAKERREFEKARKELEEKKKMIEDREEKARKEFEEQKKKLEAIEEKMKKMMEEFERMKKDSDKKKN